MSWPYVNYVKHFYKVKKVKYVAGNCVLVNGDPKIRHYVKQTIFMIALSTPKLSVRLIAH